MRPSGVELILNEILIHSRRSVIEAGSGVSTLALLSLVHDRIDRYISLDDDENWSRFVSDELCRLGIPHDRYNVVACETAAVALGEKRFIWYDSRSYMDIIRSSRFDLLIVDGPRSTLGHWARYPALPVLAPFLNDEFSVIIDDIDRGEERDIARAWADEFDLDFQMCTTRGRVGILRCRKDRSARRCI